MKDFTVVLSGYKIRVRFRDDMAKNTLGEYCTQTKTIDLDEDNPAWAQTLCHELAHAFLDISGFCEQMSGQSEEHFCRAFEHVFGPLAAKYFKT